MIFFSFLRYFFIKNNDKLQCKSKCKQNWKWKIEKENQENKKNFSTDKKFSFSKNFQ